MLQTSDARQKTDVELILGLNDYNQKGGASIPARKLHISDAMRLEPITSAPASGSQGDLYFDDSDALCVYVTAGWTKITGSGSCS